MNILFSRQPSRSVRVLLVPCLSLLIDLDSASAQQASNYAPPAGYRQQLGYSSYQASRNNVGERVGGFVKRLFYGEPQPAYPQPQYSRSAPSSGRSLDTPPSRTRSTQSAASTPPSPAKSAPTSTATAKSKTTTKPASTPSKPSSKYTPPRIKPETASPNVESKPAPLKTQDTPPPPPVSEPSTQAPTSTYTPPAPDTPPAPVSTQETAPVLDNKPTQSPQTVTTLSNTNSSELTPAPEPTAPKKETPAPSTASSEGQFLVGKKTSTPGRVVSPYPPYQELDVTGLSSGSLALDPTTDKVFQIP
jgi:hypothetical protein